MICPQYDWEEERTWVHWKKIFSTVVDLGNGSLQWLSPQWFSLRWLLHQWRPLWSIYLSSLSWRRRVSLSKWRFRGPLSSLFSCWEWFRWAGLSSYLPFSSSCPVPEDQDQEVGNLLGRKTETRLNRGCWMSSLHNMWPVMFYGRCIKLKMAALQDSCIEINSSGKSICNRNFLKRCCMPHQHLADVDDCPDLPMLFCLHSVHYFVNSGRLIFPE